MRFVIALASLLLAAPLAPAIAQTSIVAIVNGQPITSYDVAQRQQLLRLTGVKGNLKEAAINELIDERVQMRAASQARITVSDADVDAAIADIAKRVKLSPAQLSQALSQSGVDIRTLRQRLQTQIAFGRLVRAQFRASAQVTEQDLVAALLKDEEAPRQIDAAEYDLEQITIALPEDPSPQRLADAKRRAEELRSKFTSCSAGVEIAKKTRNVVVKPFGRRMDIELAPEAREAVKDVPVGRLSPPIQQARGLVMLAVCDKKIVKSTNAAMKALEPDIAASKGDQFTKQYTRQLRRDAVVERM